MIEILRVSNLKKSYKVNGKTLHAVNGVSFAVQDGKTVGLVGESGCGKSTTARCILRILEPTSGTIFFKNTDITALNERKFRHMRQEMQMVFQDASTALNPRMNIRQLLAEPLNLFRIAKGSAVEEKIREALKLVALQQSHLERYPHQLSGGQQQRVAIARALITNPELIVLDEPTASQDAAVKVLLTALLQKLQDDFGFSYVFVSHDLSTVRNLCHQVIVMYLGSIVEEGPVEEVFKNPRHPYTRALISAIPRPDPGEKKEKIILKGETPSLTKIIEGCSLKERCLYSRKRCYEETPILRKVGPDCLAACHQA